MYAVAREPAGERASDGVLGLRVASGFRGAVISELPLGLELHLLCHSQDTRLCTNAHA